jgi:16S rRNA processing protein RimM
MIREQDIEAIGHVTKTHGIHGELNITLDDGIEPDELKCLIFDMDGIYVPFFVTSCRTRGSQSWLVKLDGYDSEAAATMFVGKTIYAEADELESDEVDEDDGFYADSFVGWEMVDADSGKVIGRIEDLDLSTENVLFVVDRPDGNTLLVPVAEEFFAAIDPDNQRVTMDLPTGLVDM